MSKSNHIYPIESMKILWKLLPNFNEKENWGDPNKMNPILMFILQDLRTEINLPFSINCAYELTGHATKSQHSLANAVDFHVPGIQLPNLYNKIEERLKKLEIADLVGLGIYPDWNPKPWGGIHLDARGYKARWGKLQEEQEYCALEHALKVRYNI